MTIKNIVVVGGGPAGMMAAIRAAELKQDVTLIDKNSSLGRKLLLSGNGRCNITNACRLNSFLERFSKGGEFLRDAFKVFFNNDLIKFFQERGLEFKIENQQCVFPAVDKSHSVSEILKEEIHRNNVSVLYNSKMNNILTDGSLVKGVALKNSQVMPAHRVILATGGLSYGFTGSSGEGLDIAKKLGHKIIPPRPGLVPLEVKQEYPKLLEGLTLRNVCIRFNDGNSEISSGIGDLLFTNFGISGPLILSLSGKIVDWLIQGKDVFAEIDLRPNLSQEKLREILLLEFRRSPRKTIRNLFKTLLPQRFADVFLDTVKIPGDKKINYITQKERQIIVSTLKCLRLDIKKARPIEEAMITRGGVSLKDINPRTMESRLIKGLYFAGEMIDIDADTGGFNLQAAFSTGYLAGQSAAFSVAG